MELAPVRAEIADLMDAMSWHRARPIVRAALGRPVRKDGVWRLGKRDTLRVLEALREGPKGQASLFDYRNEP
jgi:hypothetical protein